MSGTFWGPLTGMSQGHCIPDIPESGVLSGASGPPFGITTPGPRPPLDLNEGRGPRKVPDDQDLIFATSYFVVLSRHSGIC
jgi:hypothetical protein